MPLAHPWNLSPRQAVALQRRLASLVRSDGILSRPETVAGVDVGYLPSSREAIAAVVVLSYPELREIDSSVARVPTRFPYVPGLLSFRETPAILEALARLSEPPSLILVDGQGRAHPRRFGLACHLGLWLEAPTIGVGKTLLCGTYREPDLHKGSWEPLLDSDERIGLVVRTRTRVKPVFVSVGFGVELDACARWTLKLTTRFRLPEPIRKAHALAERHKSQSSDPV